VRREGPDYGIAAAQAAHLTRSDQLRRNTLPCNSSGVGTGERGECECWTCKDELPADREHALAGQSGDAQQHFWSVAAAIGSAFNLWAGFTNLGQQ